MGNLKPLCIVAAFALMASFTTASAIVTPIPSDPVTDGISDLKDDVTLLVFFGELTPSQGTLLLRLLDSAQLRHNQGKDAAAAQLLRSFQAYLVKFGNAGLDEEIAEELFFEAQDIINLLTGQGGGGQEG